MVSSKKVQFYTAVVQRCELSKGANKAFGNRVPVLKPKIKQLSHEVEGLGIRRDGVQPFAENFFAFCRRFRMRRPQMKVTCEVNSLCRLDFELVPHAPLR